MNSWRLKATQKKIEKSSNFAQITRQDNPQILNPRTITLKVKGDKIRPNKEKQDTIKLPERLKLEIAEGRWMVKSISQSRSSATPLSREKGRWEPKKAKCSNLSLGRLPKGILAKYFIWNGAAKELETKQKRGWKNENSNLRRQERKKEGVGCGKWKSRSD